ncbi:MAG: DNA recombination protein RmuC [Bacteroidota bacterium]|nr:DNA recombination protein RmuC [Bacteroidota bacterium]MDP4205360.1 DNA recombination protein RmuC [Bacteroidota bacterium]
MEILIYILIVLVIVNIIISFAQRSKSNNGNPLFTSKLDTLERTLTKIENNLKEDFRINREESSNLSSRNRQELNTTLNTFRKEVADTLRLISEQNHKALERLTITLEEKVTALIEKTDQNNRINREEQAHQLKEFSDSNIIQLEKINVQVQQKLKELTDQAKQDNVQIRESHEKAIRSFGELFDKNVQSFNELQREKFGQLEIKQSELLLNTDKKLEEMRATVDEKLQKTLNERIGRSFETVSTQLEAVQKGLGEMRNLAQDVGGLKRVLSNVKMRGGIGEVQLAMLLEQILAPDQYETNVKTKQGSSDLVEFAIKLPGRDDTQTKVYLPIDAKFPKDVYEQLQTAYDLGDPVQFEAARKNLENTIKKMAKDIRDKYIDPPHTTDFGIMFLPFEGVYAEVVRKASLLEDLQQNYKIIVTGPTTLAAILNSLQIGFRTLALQKRSSEVWAILGAVKSEFEKFGGLLEKTQKNLNTASSTIDELIGKRTKAINRKLREVQALPSVESQQLIPGLINSEILDDDE